MARTTKPKRSTRKSEPTVESWLERGDFVRAYETLRAADPGSVSPAVRNRVYLAAAGFFADHDRTADFDRVYRDAATVTDDAEFTHQFAVVCAYGGKLADAETLIGSHPAAATVRADLLTAAADRAIRTRSRTDLPAEFHPAFDAVLAALAGYEAGDDEAARVALDGVGVRSPFREWKLLIRGLTAHAVGDSDRAAENWQRLDPDRLPARLAAPLRSPTDSSGNTTASTASQRLRESADGPLVRLLAEIRNEFSGDNSLTKAFRLVGKALPLLADAAPDLKPRLANAFYTAILAQGQPDDLNRYLKAFGPVPDDPKFARLEAIIYEQAGELETSNRLWAAYAKWLAGPPSGWPADLATRVRAIIALRMAANAVKFEAAEVNTFPPIRVRKPAKSKAPPPTLDAHALYRNAAVLAPDWDVPAEKLFTVCIDRGKPTDAENVARTFLTHRPNHLGMLDRLATMYAKAGRVDDARDARLKALDANPLDRATRAAAATALLALARRRLVDGRPADAMAALDERAGLCREQWPVAERCLRSVIARKLGQTADADTLRDEALAEPASELTAAYFLCVDSGLAKLKPADKRPADQRLAKLLGQSVVRPGELIAVYAACRGYEAEAIVYRGQKTHLKKIIDLAPKTITADATVIEFEQLVDLLAAKNEWKPCEKLAAGLAKRFPDNPVFPLALVEAEVFKAKGARIPFRAIGRLEDAKRLAEASPEPRHRQRLDRIGELDRSFNPGFFLDFLFGR